MDSTDNSPVRGEILDATTWLKANDPKVRCGKIRGKSHSWARMALTAAENAIEGAAIFLVEMDRMAVVERSRREIKRIKSGRLPLRPRSFVMGNRFTEQDHCLLVPFSSNGQISMASVGGQSLPSARLMCKYVHGDPDCPSHVARHLCGNGHLNCVNPAHLAWGTQQQNSHDRLLHRQVYSKWPAIKRDVQQSIVGDLRHPNVVAVHFNVPAHVVQMLRGW